MFTAIAPLDTDAIFTPVPGKIKDMIAIGTLRPDIKQLNSISHLTQFTQSSGIKEFKMIVKKGFVRFKLLLIIVIVIVFALFFMA